MRTSPSSLDRHLRLEIADGPPCRRSKHAHEESSDENEATSRLRPAEGV